MKDLVSIAAFLRKHVRKLHADQGKRSRENLLMWLSWHSSRYDACAVEDNGEIVAVGVARAINDPLDARVAYLSDETGQILFVEQVAATTNEGFRRVLHYARKRWPNCTKIMFNRSKGSNKNRIYDFDVFMKKTCLESLA